jgi:hypothetical protein
VRRASAGMRALRAERSAWDADERVSGWRDGWASGLARRTERHAVVLASVQRSCVRSEAVMTVESGR